MNETGFRPCGWRKSSYSGDSGDCVEVASGQAAVGVRDTKDRGGGFLSLTAEAWTRLVTTFD